MKRMRAHAVAILVLALTIGAATHCTAAAEPTADKPTLENVTYGPHERNVLDLWLAKSDRPTPLVVFIHGGGFRRGDKESVRGRPVVKQCLDAGVSFASINYRFLDHAGIADILRDSARAIQTFRQRAKEWNLDPARIAAYGSSAGAGTSMWLAFHDDLADPKADDPVRRQSSRLAAAGSLDGQVSYDLREWARYVGESPYERNGAELAVFYGFQFENQVHTPDGDRVMKDCSMIELISPGDPPVGIACFRPDGVPVDRGHYVHHPKHSVALAERCKQQGVECLLVLEKDIGGDRAKQAEKVVAYLIEKLKAGG
ncbi:MAG: alpha/beta hydrolase [Pirellulales bacterium]